MDDFCGFTYKGVHSSELGLVRVSDGSRYFHNLTANFRDKTMEIPGGDGTYFFESLYNSNTFNINVAFDSVTEVQMRLIRQVFNGKDAGELIFDETPYKAYIVKVQSAPQIKYVCFLENGERIYKGEMTVVFISYYPYAFSTKKWDEEYSEYLNHSEWHSSVNLASNVGNHYDYCSSSGTTIINLYNPGDLSTDFKVFLRFETLTNGTNLKLMYTDGTPVPQAITQLNLKSIFESDKLDPNDNYICINTKTCLIEGFNDLPSANGVRTGSLYNSYISSGDFFKIPIHVRVLRRVDLILTTSNGALPSPGVTYPLMADIDYDYLYY